MTPAASPAPLPTPPPASARVSVALCTFNGARFLAEQIDSIARQTRPVDEVILCDDGSTDDTLAVARKFQAALPNLQIHQNPIRLGVTKNFEHAIARCSGDVIFLCDQDDLWKPAKVERLLTAMNPPGIGPAVVAGIAPAATAPSPAPSAAMAFCDADVISEHGHPAGYRLWDSIWFDPGERQRVAEGAALPVLLRHAVAAGCTLAFRAEYRPLVLPMPDLPHVHDVWITLLLACVGRLAPVSEPLVSYRLHGQNTVGMRRYNLLGQLRMARHQLSSGAFAQLATLHAAARERLVSQSSWPPSPAAIALLDEKIRHSRIRDEMARQPSGRWGNVWSEWRRGNYHRFSYGFKSLLQDVFLR